MTYPERILSSGLWLVWSQPWLQYWSPRWQPEGFGLGYPVVRTGNPVNPKGSRDAIKVSSVTLLMSPCDGTKGNIRLHTSLSKIS